MRHTKYTGFNTPDLFPASEVEAPSATKQQLIRDLVQNYAREHHGDKDIGTCIRDTWHFLYGRMCNSSLRFNVYARNRSIGGRVKASYLETVELFGYTDELYAIAKRDLV